VTEIYPYTDYDCPEESTERAVYVIRNEVTGAIKIGVSNAPERRRVELQAACGMPLRMLCYVRHVNAFGIERILHDRHAERRLVGEWFAAHPDIDVDIALLRENLAAIYNESEE